jgi:hypothetical protein
MFRTHIFRPLIEIYYELGLNVDNRYDFDPADQQYYDNVERFEKILKRDGFKKLGSGINVTAFGNGQWALKFAFYGCKTEKYDLRKLHPKLRKYFVKPVYHDEFVVAQTQVTIPERVRTNEIVDKFNAITNCDVWSTYDVHNDNVGMLNGQPAIFDFGACC